MLYTPLSYLIPYAPNQKMRTYHVKVDHIISTTQHNILRSGFTRSIR
ncbi:hypothetical protein VCHA50P416_60277 [Vibrio chagasii]|nr:hypothetical protein VCHA36O157_30053 [Vibrio chagasii]CAH7234118.1 hypothetical protein VCHA52P455_30042 [Vibrio chagasii]CAH7465594.1 hypothetical protein VCHA50P416_60277 [Vibrio chagasii]